MVNTILIDFKFLIFSQRLDPLDVPQLTAEQLAEKQRLADEKREEVQYI